MSKPELSSLIQHKIKVQDGDIISKRIGIGEDVGYSFFQAPHPDQLKADILDLQRNPPIQT